MIKTAEISRCERHRFKLGRVWDTNLPVLLWVMLNPSTADASIDDPTIRRCINYAKDWDFGGIEVVNLFSLRTPSPKVLIKTSVNERNHSSYNDILEKVFLKHDAAICGWGTNGTLDNRNKKILDMMNENGCIPFCIDKTSLGEPKHPLYLKKDLLPKELRG